MLFFRSLLASPAVDWEGKVETSRLVCAVSGQPIAPGERFFSALLAMEQRFARLDFSATAWTAQDQARFLGWWRQTAPSGDGPAAKAINLDALVQLFASLKETHDRTKQCLGFVIALFLLRARKLRFIATQDEGGHTYLVVEDRVNQTTFRLRDPGLTADEQAAVQQNLIEVMDLAA